MMYRPRYLKNKKSKGSCHQLNEFSTEGGQIVLNGELLRGVRSYDIVWNTGELTELKINMIGKMK
nr:MAG TPA: hypothetical protein [Caudoviricetes sp.]